MMRKRILILVIVFVAIGKCYAQYESTLGMGLNLGNVNGGELEFFGEYLFDKGKRFNSGYVFGLGICLPIERNTLGVEEVWVDPDDLISSGIQKGAGVYFSGGYTLHRFSLLGRLGYYSLEYYENGFDYEFYHSTDLIEPFFLYGAALHVKITKGFAVNVGYNNYSGTNIGLNFRFNLQ